MFYLYRNGIGETYSALSTAKAIFLRSIQEHISREIDIYIIYVLVVFSFVGVMTVMSIPVTRKLQQAAIRTSNLLYMCDIGTYYEEKQRALERLSSRYEVDIEPAIEHPVRGHRRSRSLYHPVALVLAAWGVLWTLLVVFYFPLYFLTMQQLATRLQLSPRILAQDSTCLVKIIETNLWAAEIVLARVKMSNADFIPVYSTLPSPNWLLTHVEEEFHYSRKELLDLTRNDFEISPDHSDFLYKTTNFTSIYMRKGYQLGLNLLSGEISFCANSPTGCPSNIYLYKTFIELAGHIYDISNYYESDCKQLSKASFAVIVSLLYSFSVGVLMSLVVFLVVFRVKVHNTGKSLLKVCETMGVAKVRGMKDSTVDVSRGVTIGKST